MYHCCTLSDYNYLLKGLVLYDSLEKYTKEDFVLYYFCLDNETYNKLNELNLKHIIPINLKDLEYDHLELQNIKKQITYQNYCFTLSSYFCWYLLEHCMLQDILYIDSDIVFYDSLKKIFDTVKDKSIGLIRHRHVSYGHYVGYYNVGIIYFDNKEGLKCCEFWKDLMLNPNNEYSKEYGTCGDQKYLELFEKKFDGVKIIDENGIGYFAPYNLDLYSYENFSINDKKIIWNGKEEKIIFNHFIKFKPDFENDTYVPVETLQEWNKLSKIKEVVEIYNEYFELNKEIKNRWLN